MPTIDLPTSSNPGREGADGAARLINCYPEDRGREGKSAFGLYASDGLKLFSTLSGGGETRGLIVSGSSLYAISGKSIFKVDEGGGNASIGAIASDGRVYMALNLKATPQIIMVGSGVRGLIENDVVIGLVDSDLKPSNSVTFINQRFVHTMSSGNGEFQWSAISEGTDYNALDFATAEYAPDGLVRAITRQSELLLFGPETIEPWYTPETGSNVFARSGSVVSRGCLAGASVAQIGDFPYFVADDETVRVLEGYTARRVSNHAVERSIRDTSDQGALDAFTYSKDGHEFYVLSGNDFTWSHDQTTGSWVERESYELPRWRASHAVKFAGKTIVGDYQSNKLYEIDEDTFDENGDPLVMEAHIPVHAFPKKIKLDELRIDTIPGVGTATTDPKVIVKLSKNGGKTFGNERQVGMGKLGEYFKQVRLNRLGTSNEDGFVVAVSSSAAVVRAIVSASAEFQIMSN